METTSQFNVLASDYRFDNAKLVGNAFARNMQWKRRFLCPALDEFSAQDGSSRRQG